MEIRYDYPPRRSKRLRAPSYIWLLLFIVIISIIAGLALSGYYYWNNFAPSTERVSPDFGGHEKPVFYNGEQTSHSALGSGESLKFPLELIREHLDSNIVYESESDSVIVTTADKVIRLKTEQLTGFVNEEPFTLSFPVEITDGIVYVPLEPLKGIYNNFQVLESEETGAVFLRKNGDAVQWGSVAERSDSDGLLGIDWLNFGTGGQNEPHSIQIRTQSSIKAPIVADLMAGQRLMIWGEENGWYRVQLDNGITGFAEKDDIALDGIEVVAIAQRQPSYIPWKPLGGKIILTWEHVVSRNPDTSKIGDMPGLNVVSPTWFHLKDEEGNIANLASASYVKWAHSRGYQVWALFSNNFDPDITTKVLSDYDSRMKVIRQLLSFAQTYDFQGINVDFENVYVKDKDKLTQFVRELTPLAHEQGLVVSIDVTIRGGSPMWSLFYDREALGKIVDYIIVMTYDEHWASSPVAGSVASLPWAEKGIADIIREDRVPPSKLLLGVPYYTRIWTEETIDGKTKVSSRAVSMAAIQKLIAEKNVEPVFLENVGQYYFEYAESKNVKVRVWMEDSTSMTLRSELVKKYDLAGIASWRRGFETPDIWETIGRTLEKRP